MDVPPQDVITRDNVSVKVNAVIFFRVLDANKAVISVEDYLYATSQMAQTTLRSVLGQQELDDLLASREKINEELTRIIDQHTNPWGVKVAAVEVFGEESAKRYEKLQRQANSMNRERADHASDEIEAMESSLTDAQRKRLFGEAAEGPGAEEYGGYLDAINSLDAETPQSLGQSLRWAITEIGEGTDPAKMGYKERIRYAQIREAFEIAKERGFDHNRYVYVSELETAERLARRAGAIR